MNILLADDDEDVRLLLTDALEALGHIVVSVHNGKELLRQLGQGPGDFNVIVTDNDMPGGPSGVEVLAFLRRDTRFSSVPIIVHTSSKHLETRVVSLGGMFAEKEASFDALIKTIDVVQTVLHYRSNP